MKALLLGVVLAGLSLSATAQQPQYKMPKATPARNTEKQTKSAAPLKLPATQTSSASQDLKRIEQSTGKTSGVKKTAARTTPKAATLPKASRQNSNPPINFSAASSHASGMNKQGANPYKGRLKQKSKLH